MYFMTTNKALLLDILLRERLGDGLTEVVERLRGKGWSYRAIAELISDETGVTVTYESLRTWYPDTERASA